MAAAACILDPNQGLDGLCRHPPSELSHLLKGGGEEPNKIGDTLLQSTDGLCHLPPVKPKAGEV